MNKYSYFLWGLVIVLLSPFVLIFLFIVGGIEKVVDWSIFLFDIIFGTQHHIDYINRK